MSYYAGRGGGGGASISPSGGGRAGGGMIPAGGGVGGGGGARPQKTEVNSHVQQSQIGGPGARQPGGDMSHMPGGPTHPNIGEHGGRMEGGEPRTPSQRDERAHPDQFRNFDQRFDRDRDRLGNNYWRIAFTDYDRDRFLPLLAEDPWLYHIFGVNYYPELIQYAVPFYPTQCGPWGSGIWAIGTDSRWYPIRHHHLDIIRRIELQRGIGRYEPVIVPNCGIGVSPYQPITPVPTLYPAPRVSYPYTI